MKNSPSDNQEVPIILRTKDLVIAETITLIALLCALIWSIFKAEIPLIGTIPMLIGPGVYTLFWRQRSIKYETSNPKQELQSGATIICFIWSCFQSIIALPTAIMLFVASISQDFTLFKIFHIIPLLVTAIFTFYLLKSFARSIKIDSKKSSI